MAQSRLVALAYYGGKSALGRHKTGRWIAELLKHPHYGEWRFPDSEIRYIGENTLVVRSRHRGELARLNVRHVVGWWKEFD